MTDERKRERRITAPLPIGVGGLPPFPARGPVVTLRVLGRGIEIALAPERVRWQIGRAGSPPPDLELPFDAVSRVHASIVRIGAAIEIVDLGSKNGLAEQRHRHDWRTYQPCRSTVITAGKRFQIGDARLMALDAETARLAPLFRGFCGADAHDAVDRALAATIAGDVLVLPAERRADAIELARAIHDGTERRPYPFTIVERIPESDVAIDALCRDGGCGTIVLDLGAGFVAPDRLAENVFAEDAYHLRCVVLAESYGDFDVRYAALWRHRFGRDLCFVRFPDDFT